LGAEIEGNNRLGFLVLVEGTRVMAMALSGVKLRPWV
jgi:hypothetical protein